MHFKQDPFPKIAKRNKANQWTSIETKTLVDAFAKYGLDYGKLTRFIPSKNSEQISHKLRNLKDCNGKIDPKNFHAKDDCLQRKRE